MNLLNLENKHILVTGASSGIGKAISVLIDRLEASLYLTARNKARLQETADLCLKSPMCLQADIDSDDDIDSMIDQLPILNGLVLCAGTNKKEPVNYISQDSVDLLISTNFSSNVFLIKKLLRKKRIAPGASIVFISSISVDRPAPGNAIYAATKGAIKSYSKVLAIELSKKKIRVNTIEPGMVKTEWLEKSVTTDEQFAKDEGRYPLGRYGAPEDIANATAFLLSDASSWMTGSDLRIDGGISLI